MEEKAIALGCLEPVALYCQIARQCICARWKSEVETQGEDYLLAGALLATALFLEAQGADGFTVGEFTHRPSASAVDRARALREAAEQLLCGKLNDEGFLFLGVQA